MVGAVIVHNGRIIGEGYHQRCGEAHAEVNAIANVRRPELLRESTLYVSLEPCAHYGKTPPCANLIVEKRIPRVIIGCRDPFAKVDGRGIAILREAGVEVVVGVLEQECLWLNRRFITFHTQKRPYITLKWAQSKDGFIDRIRNSHEELPVKFSTPLTSALVHKLRSENDAILVGRRTWELDKPSLTVRHWYGRNPRPIVLSKKNDDYPTDLNSLMKKLHEDGVQTLLVEGGSRTLQSFIDAGLWDEARVETSPLVLIDGVKAPTLNAKVERKIQIDGNCITLYTKKS
jgi:diaminohydroxyphosphoribosylaminopyrimidine deaminase/5-amino-6-(5-phosphoribosylamino)uracil reductase